MVDGKSTLAPPATYKLSAISSNLKLLRPLKAAGVILPRMNVLEKSSSTAARNDENDG